MRVGQPPPESCVVSVRLDSSADEPYRRYGLEQLLRLIGLRTRFEPYPHTTIYYGTNPRMGALASVWIPVEETPSHPRSPFDEPLQLTAIGDVAVPWRTTRPTSLWVGNRLSFDLGLAVAFWLTLESERRIPERDLHGRVPAAASLPALSGWSNRPPVQTYARLLKERLSSCGEFEEALPSWPSGKRYAVALSHDVDAPERASRMPGLLTEIVLDGRRPRRHAYWDLRAEIRSRGFLNTWVNPVEHRKEWDFAEFCGLEKHHGLRSAFYLGVATNRTGHACDVGYDTSHPRYRKLCQGLGAGGWEVGLQAGYLTYAERPPARAQYETLLGHTGVRALGTRHHYLQLGSERPLRTLVAHAAAGAEYDASVGFNDAPGFRAGTAFPFEVFDPDRRSVSPLIELPMTIADMHLPRRDEAAAVSAVLEHLETVRALGGLAVLNWHVGNWHSAPGWRESYRAACRFLAEDSTVWVATPREVAAWWRRRTGVIQ